MFKALYCHASAPGSIAARRRPPVHSLENEYLVEILRRLTAAWKGTGHPPTQCCGSGRVLRIGCTNSLTSYGPDDDYDMNKHNLEELNKFLSGQIFILTIHAQN